MKIGIMLRHFGQPGGIGIYTANIVNALLEVDQRNQYVLIYNQPKHLGTYRHFQNATEVVAQAPNIVWWDQITIPAVVRRENLDLVFNPKLSIPLFAGCKTVLISHGGAHFVVPDAFPWYDRAYFTIANHLYFKRASAIISVTSLGAQEIVKYMRINPQKVHPIHESYNERCRVLPKRELEPIKQKYQLPEQFVLWVGGISPLKNIGNLLRAYASVGGEFPHQLVMAGFKRWKFSKDMDLIDELGLHDRILFPGYVQPEDIPALYNLASVFVFPSLYEGFGLPILEAMACGCPVITSTTGYAPEVAGGAAILVDPHQPSEIADAMRTVLKDDACRSQMVQAGLRWVKEFGWRKCATETIALFESLGEAAQSSVGTLTKSHSVGGELKWPC
jgi:glycosyltransferase involved in cell wall biosynthesis